MKVRSGLVRPLVVALIGGGFAISSAAADQARSPQPGIGVSQIREALYKINLDGSGRERLVGQVRILDLSPDRTRAVLARDAGDGLERMVVVRSLATGEETVLATMPYGIEYAAWSPDGHTIALDVVNTSECIPPATRCAFWDTWLVGADGNNLRAFAPYGRWPTWSPDSRRLAFAARYFASSEDGILTVADVMTGRQRTIRRRGPIKELTWSRHRGLIAYLAIGGRAANAIRVVGVDRRFSRTAPPGSGLDWSPNGRRLAFARTITGRHALSLTLFDPASRRLRRIASGNYLAWPTWSPRGRLIAYAMADRIQQSTGHVWLVRPSGAWRHQVSDDSTGTGIIRIFWAPGGRAIFYVTVGGTN